MSSEDDSDDFNDDVEIPCIRKRRKFIRRNRIQGHERLYRDYFAEDPVYPSNLFRRRFCMRRPLFIRILNEVVAHEPYFVQKRGMYSGHIREPTIILEAVASYDLWIWHAFFGMPGSHNDINVLERSFVFTELTQGCAPPVNYTVNGHDYTIGYYLADGIYPKWQTFVKTIPSKREQA
ncbi:uncharacterized protein LOC143627166 [Bidens hawaiensis]|uniref:uncharacterized protein LOC143627166 n=1 Tax=Bidens hawaiensis TaxID=980011 RepID=UPI00404B9850